MKDLSEIREHYAHLELEGKENYTVKKGKFTRKVDDKTADKMKKQGWKIIAKEETVVESDLTEGPYVASYNIIFDIILKDLKKEMEEAYKKGKIEIINNIARLAKHKVSDKEQQKGKLWLNNKGN
tara:strand:+ start:943 stop:1317 length:375 start_codon:yes stop_codon:yes gene_type:complete